MLPLCFGLDVGTAVCKGSDNNLQLVAVADENRSES